MSFSLSLVRPAGFSTQRPGSNGGMQRCYSLLVMLESELHIISFCVTDLTVFVCHCRQINCGVVWRTEPPPQPPSPSSVPPTSLHSLLARVYLPLSCCPPLVVKSSRSRSRATYCLLSSCLSSFRAGRLLFYSGSSLHDPLENCFQRCSAISQFPSPSSNPSP